MGYRKKDKVGKIKISTEKGIYTYLLILEHCKIKNLLIIFNYILDSQNTPGNINMLKDSNRNIIKGAKYVQNSNRTSEQR